TSELFASFRHQLHLDYKRGLSGLPSSRPVQSRYRSVVIVSTGAKLSKLRCLRLDPKFFASFRHQLHLDYKRGLSGLPSSRPVQSRYRSVVIVSTGAKLSKLRCLSLDPKFFASFRHQLNLDYKIGLSGLPSSRPVQSRYRSVLIVSTGAKLSKLRCLRLEPKFVASFRHQLHLDYKRGLSGLPSSRPVQSRYRSVLIVSTGAKLSKLRCFRLDPKGRRK
ncbi:hypothetical protein J6590_038474, partial [Homalodisca vitripennis]